MPPLGSALAILRRAKFADLPVQMIQRPYGQFLESSVARQPGATFDVPERTAHPVLIARSLLQIALSLQLLSNTGSARSLQSAKGASHRYFEAATQYVTSQDLLLGSYDGLEALMLEGLYQINEGNLRQGWLAFRRAIGIAQVMKVPIQSQKEEEDDESEPDPSINQVLTKSQFLWFRLNYSDRFLSLMLGLPFAAADDSFVSSRVMAADVPVGRLERMHTIIMGRLISRNQRITAAHHTTQALQSELEETDSIDQELQRVLRQFPGHWWLSPHLCDLTTGAIDSLEETSRLLAQVNQANLLLLLHLPYAIQGFSSSPQLDYAYNMHNTIKASRDVLSRFVLYRKFNQVPSCCRAVDSKALTASASLVLAHLDGHRLGRANVLMHQRLEDLGLVQMAIKSIEGLVALSPKSQGEIEARVLKGLLDTEARAADGVLHTIHFDEWGSGGECYVFEEGETLDFRAPYFGRVRIEPLEVRPNPRAAAPGGPLDRQFGIATSTSSSEEIEAWPSLQSVAPGNAVASLAGLFPGMGPLTGEFVESKSGRYLTVYNPKDGCLVSDKVALADAADVEDAVVEAEAAFPAWRKTPPNIRRDMLLNLATLILKHSQALAAMTRLTLGGPVSVVGGMEVGFAVEALRYFAGWTDKLAGETYPEEDGFFKIVRQEPLGVVSAITPWNAPIGSFCAKAAPALATGNCFIIKLSEKTPFAGLAMGSLVKAAGFPPGVFQILSGDGSTGAAISSHMRIRKVSFTGSTLTGKKIQEMAARSNLKRVTLELGGKSPALVFDDANLDNAVTWCVNAITINTGQACFAATRVYVQSRIYHAFVNKYKALVEEKTQFVGDPDDPKTIVGPVVDEAQFNRVMGFIDRGRSQGKL
ncbi:hypothetical protein NW754_000456 [Fusarium falciforme]|nr:hypothetical protein NW754_000456 [Fusarium falciforme]